LRNKGPGQGLDYKLEDLIQNTSELS
jgi:hypothetical protein